MMGVSRTGDGRGLRALIFCHCTSCFTLHRIGNHVSLMPAKQVVAAQ
jgi:hypothetical protein